MDKAAADLINSPKLALYVRRFEDVLKREEARRAHFYEGMSEGQKVEFINGEVIVHSPVKKRHNDCGQRLLTLLRTYVQRHDLGFVGYEKILVSLTRNDYEPDLCFFGQDKARALRPDQMKFPAPDLAVEILSESTEAVDRGVKFIDYAAHGVLEYWLLDPETEVLEQYLLPSLESERYELALKSGTGLVCSVAVAGFEIPVRAIFDDQENLRVLAELLS